MMRLNFKKPLFNIITLTSLLATQISFAANACEDLQGTYRLEKDSGICPDRLQIKVSNQMIEVVNQRTGAGEFKFEPSSDSSYHHSLGTEYSAGTSHTNFLNCGASYTSVDRYGQWPFHSTVRYHATLRLNRKSGKLEFKRNSSYNTYANLDCTYSME